MMVHIILYVRDQLRSTAFYSRLLDMKPHLNVPGMTEFELNSGCILGLMPEVGVKKILGASLPDPSTGSGLPRAEIYLRSKDARLYYSRALKAGALNVSDMELRDWGDVVGYCVDMDGHVLAFAEEVDL